LGGVGDESAFVFDIGTSSTTLLTVPAAFTVTVDAGDVALLGFLFSEPGAFDFLSQLAMAAAIRTPVMRVSIFMT
jgi:hypothetical protein